MQAGKKATFDRPVEGRSTAGVLRSILLALLIAGSLFLARDASAGFRDGGSFFYGNVYTKSCGRRPESARCIATAGAMRLHPS